MASQPTQAPASPLMPRRPENLLDSLQCIFDELSDGVIVCDNAPGDAPGRVLLANSVARQGLQFDPVDAGKSWVDLLSSEDAPPVAGVEHAPVDGAVIALRTLQDRPWRVALRRMKIGDDGDARWACILRPVVRESPHDIQALNRLAAAVEQAAEAVMICDIGQQVQYVNPAFSQITGFDRAELLGQSARLFFSERGDPDLAQKILQDLVQGRVWSGRLRYARRDGAIIDMEGTISPIQDETGIVVSHVHVMRDVSRSLQLESQLLHAQKMEAVGRLAGGVAHDFNNLLTVINGHTDLMLRRKELDEARRHDLQEIRKAGERAAGLTRQLLAFSRRQRLQPKIFDPRQVISDLERMLRRLIGEDVELVLELGDERGMLYADPGQFEQVVMNLVINARDAMPNGGRVSIAITADHLDEEYRWGESVIAPGEFLCLRIADTGSGMDEKTLSRIFEPFFTTKEQGKGTGLGLSTVYGIVQQSGGFIRVESKPGEGSAFSVCFPRVTRSMGDAQAEPELHAGKTGGAERILLVEDDAMVRNLVRELLRAQGYEVIEAADGASALELSNDPSVKLDLLMTDVIMPQMNGVQLADAIRQNRPRLRVLFMSGYTETAVQHLGMLDGHQDYLQKPFTARSLETKVREILDQA